MQVLEAMACGTPVITTDNSSLAEVGGDAAFYAKTGDQESLNNQLEALLANPAELKRRRKLGLKHASKFSWEISAGKLLQLFDELSK